MAGLFHGRSTVARGRCKEGGAYRQHMVVRCAGCGVPGQGWRADGSSCGAALRANTLGPSMFSTPWRPRRGLVLARYAPETSGLQVQEGGDLSNYSMIENRLQRPVIGRQQLFISYCNMAPNGYRLFWPLQVCAGAVARFTARCASWSPAPARSTRGSCGSGLPSASAWPPRRSAAPT